MSTIILSGATGSIGGEIAAQIAATASVSRLVLLVRDLERGAALASKIQRGPGQIELEKVDLADAADVAACGARLARKYPQVDALVNNAAVVPDKRIITRDGHELQWQVNVLSYFMLMQSLLPSLAASKGVGRVVNVASDYAGDLDLADVDWSRRRRYNSNSAYRSTKEANRRLSWEARSRGFGVAGVAVVALMPGVVTSTLLQGLGMRRGFDSAAKAGAGPAWLATEARLEPVGSSSSSSSSSSSFSSSFYYHGQQASKCQWDNAQESKSNARLWEMLDAAAAPYLAAEAAKAGEVEGATGAVAGAIAGNTGATDAGELR